jgi:lysozyme
MTRSVAIVTLLAATSAAWSACGIDGAPGVDESSVEQANTSQCATSTVLGIDVSSAQGTVTWTKVAAAGRAFAFIKATQGNYNDQTTFKADWASAASAGVLRSAYHFFDPTKDGSAQATFFLDELTAAGGMTDGDLPPMLDIECPVSSSEATATSQGSGCEYPANSGWVATATMKQRIYDWLDAVEAATARKPIIYSYPSWFADVAFTDAKLADYPLFIATYATCASVPAPWTSAVFWQYSASGTVTGVTGDVDEDKFFGSASDLTTWNANSNERDAGVVDASGDGGVMDDGGGPDAGTAEHGKGCGCASSGDDAGGLAQLVAAIAIVALVWRRRR